MTSSLANTRTSWKQVSFSRSKSCSRACFQNVNFIAIVIRFIWSYVRNSKSCWSNFRIFKSCWMDVLQMAVLWYLSDAVTTAAYRAECWEVQRCSCWWFLCYKCIFFLASCDVTSKLFVLVVEPPRLLDGAAVAWRQTIGGSTSTRWYS